MSMFWVAFFGSVAGWFAVAVLCVVIGGSKNGK